MCLAIPAKVIEVSENGGGIVDVGGIRKEISLMLLDDVGVGDYVIVHVGCAIAKLDEAEAARTLALFAEIAEQVGEQDFADALRKETTE